MLYLGDMRGSEEKMKKGDLYKLFSILSRYGISIN